MAKKPKKKNKSKYTAKTADKYELYQLAVQSPAEDVEFLQNVYRDVRGRKAKHFREDFCGTCLLTANWIAQGKSYTAEAFDIDPEPLEWGRMHNLEPLGKATDQARQHLKDAREPSDRRPDVRCAQNFSYWVFTSRDEMLDYFRKARSDLAEDGLFVVDVHGGPESLEEMAEETELEDGFTYVWDQHKVWPITGQCLCYIHFKFPDGTRLKKAFEYHWRLWGLTELKDILANAGFSRIDCYWEGTDEDGESGNGVFTREERGEHCLSYVAYLVARK
ncbi:MAG: class I SAM-dependent methyltransferase [Gammaproteobacteria bacterium]|nr:class I SAM-dependent methyltransferase [Gammaproteobacteria bacterium]